MPKRKSDDSYEYLSKKIRKLERKLKRKDRRSRSRPSRSHPRSSRSPTPTSTTPPLPLPSPPPPLPPKQPGSRPSVQPQSTQLKSIQPPQPLIELPQPPEAQPETSASAPPTQTESKEELPEEFLLALGHEGEEHNETGEPITNELALRWAKIMNEGLTKEQREALLAKYSTPSNFKTVNPPILNKEIAATLSETSLNRDKRIVARQNLTGKLLSCLGKTLSEVLKGNINSKNLILEISDAAKIAAEIYFNDSKSRKFFALSNASKAVQEACKDAKTDKYLFGEALSDQIKSIQAVKRTAAQINKETEKPPVKNLNWRGPPHYQTTSHRGRGGQRPMRRPQVTQPPRRSVPSRGKYVPRRGNQRRF